MMGGRAAERLVFDESSAGAENDLKQATRLARYMVTHWGMSERLGPVAFRIGEEHLPGQGDPGAARLQRGHGPAHRRGGRAHPARGRRAGHRAADRRTATSSTALAKRLEEQEVLDEREIEAIIGPSFRSSRSNGQPEHMPTQPAAK